MEDDDGHPHTAAAAADAAEEEEEEEEDRGDAAVGRTAEEEWRPRQEASGGPRNRFEQAASGRCGEEERGRETQISQKML